MHAENQCNMVASMESPSIIVSLATLIRAHRESMQHGSLYGVTFYNSLSSHSHTSTQRINGKLPCCIDSLHACMRVARETIIEGDSMQATMLH